MVDFAKWKMGVHAKNGWLKVSVETTVFVAIQLTWNGIESETRVFDVYRANTDRQTLLMESEATALKLNEQEVVSHTRCTRTRFLHSLCFSCFNYFLSVRIASMTRARAQQQPQHKRCIYWWRRRPNGGEPFLCDFTFSLGWIRCFALHMRRSVCMTRNELWFSLKMHSRQKPRCTCSRPIRIMLGISCIHLCKATPTEPSAGTLLVSWPYFSASTFNTAKRKLVAAPKNWNEKMKADSMNNDWIKSRTNVDRNMVHLIKPFQSLHNNLVKVVHMVGVLGC